MAGAGLYIVGILAGVAAYFVGRAVLRFRDFHRDAICSERNQNVVRLLTPYEREISLDDASNGARAATRLRAVVTEFDQAG